MNTQTNTEVRHYLDRMREALADLPAAEVGEIMDDAEAHVVEVAEEMGDEFSLAALTDRLGTPQAYARELRTAAGYPAPDTGPPGGRPTLSPRFALWSLVACTAMGFAFGVSGGENPMLLLLIGLCAVVATVMVFRHGGLLGEIARLPETAALTDALRKAERADEQRLLASLRVLQPVWWVGRALLIAGVGMLGGLFFPSSGVFTLALGALSVVAGIKVRTDRRWLWISLPATGFALGVLLFALTTLVTGLSHRSAPVSYNPAPPTPGNVYVFDKDGKPLTDVHLYDEDGRPIDTPWYGCDGQSRDDNRYPRPRVVRDQDGCREVPGVPFTVVMPTAPSADTTPSPSSPTPSPSRTPAPSLSPSAPATPTTVEVSPSTTVTPTG